MTNRFTPVLDLQEFDLQEFDLQEFVQTIDRMPLDHTRQADVLKSVGYHPTNPAQANFPTVLPGKTELPISLLALFSSPERIDHHGF